MKITTKIAISCFVMAFPVAILNYGYLFGIIPDSPLVVARFVYCAVVTIAALVFVALGNS